MDSAVYTTLTRQTGLLRELEAVANNIANAATTGFRAEGVIFAEHVARVPGEDGGTLAMAVADGRRVDLGQGELRGTGGTFDLAIEGPGFFLIETPEGEALTRAGHFVLSETGFVVTPDGRRLLGGVGAPILVPPDAGSVSIARDGTISADGLPVAQINVWGPADPADLTYLAGTAFAAPGGVVPVPEAALLQGHLEGSNVDTVAQVARMIEVQRAYEMGAQFLEREDRRVRDFLRAMASN